MESEHQPALGQDTGTATSPPSQSPNPLVVSQRTTTMPVPAIPGRTPRRLGRSGWWLIVPVLLLVAWAIWYWVSAARPVIQYKTAVVDRGPVTTVVTATGTVNPVTSVQVGSQVSGKIRALYADFNSEVTSSQLIAQIDPAPFRTRVNQARATLRSARGTLVKSRALLAQRKLELDRMVSLRQQRFVAQSELDLARTNFLEAQAQVEVNHAQVDQAEAALANAELDLGYTKIYSPVDGTVISRNVDVGQTVVATFQTPTLFVIAQDLTYMQVNTNVSEADIGGVTEGTRAHFTVDAYPSQPFTGTVEQVRNAPISIQNVVTYDVVVTVANPELKLKPGMTANVSIVTAHKDQALRVPAVALRFKPPEALGDKLPPTVWLLDDGRLRPVSVEPGITDGAYTEVAPGPLQPGDRVVTGIESPEEVEGKELPPGFGMGPRFR